MLSILSAPAIELCTLFSVKGREGWKLYEALSSSVKIKDTIPNIIHEKNMKGHLSLFKAHLVHF